MSMHVSIIGISYLASVNTVPEVSLIGATVDAALVGLGGKP
jgi:hypothetical protein